MSEQIPVSRMTAVRRTDRGPEAYSKTNHEAAFFIAMLAFLLSVAGMVYFSYQLQTIKREVNALHREISLQQLQIDWLSVVGKMENGQRTEHYFISGVVPFAGGDPLTLKLVVGTAARQTQELKNPNEMTELIRLTKSVYERYKTPSLPEWDELKIVLSMTATYDKLSGETR